jgi:hypothetical protein
MSVADRSLKKLGPWPAGINNVAQDTEVPAGALRSALNVDLTDEGKPRRRGGQSSIYAGDARSLYSSGDFTIFAEADVLKRLFADNSTTTLYAGLDSNNPISYAEVNTTIYFTDGDNNLQTTLGGVVSPLGLPSPVTLPALTTTTTGGMDEGTYQVASTEVTSNGEESGAGMAQVVTLTQGQGILVSGVSFSSGASATNIYVSKANGEVLYYHSQTSSTSTSIMEKPQGRKLETQFMDELPAGQLMFYYKGRLWVAQDNVLWYSEPLRYGLCRLSANFIQFPERITIGQAVLDGIYIVADKGYFLAGTDPKQMQQVVVSPYRAVEGTGMILSPDVFGLEDVLEDTAYWFGTNGAVLGLPGGAVKNITEDRLVVPDYVSGATMLRSKAGIQQVISAVRNPGEESTMKFGDTASAEVVRNGITLP